MARRPSQTTGSRSARKSTSRTTKQSNDIKARKAGQGGKPRSWALYGRSGSGKTTLAASFPGPVALINIRDDGDDSVSDVKSLDVYDVESTDDLEATYWRLKSGNLAGKYRTVILDTVTMWQQMKIEEIVGAKAERMGKQPTDWGVMKKQEWGEVSGYLKTWITNFRDLDIEVVFIAQERSFNVGEDEDNVGELDPEVGPSLSPATKGHLCAAVSVIGHTFVRSREVTRKVRKKEIKREVTEYCLRLGPSASYITKFRKPKRVSLPDFLIDPTYEDILDTIKGDN